MRNLHGIADYTSEAFKALSPADQAAVAAILDDKANAVAYMKLPVFMDKTPEWKFAFANELLTQAEKQQIVSYFTAEADPAAAQKFLYSAPFKTTSDPFKLVFALLLINKGWAISGKGATIEMTPTIKPKLTATTQVVATTPSPIPLWVWPVGAVLLWSLLK